MKSLNNIRAGFLDFFKANGHEIRPSSPLVPHNDPTLMFTNAGMNQFKNVFTGAEKLPFSRAASSQKCVRAGGKHNDLDNVGYTARHHTFFEMLGNFSFGDYFKEEAIKLAWDLLTKDFAIAPDKLTVTIYHDDDDAFRFWKKISGFPDSKIIRINTNDNFWAMGDTGPCGPCSEIFYDHGDKIPGGPPGSPDADGDRFTEIWNLVFMQFDQQPDGTRVNLPKPSIDTGMGLERIAAVLQGVHDNYEIDLFRHLIRAIEEESRIASRASRGKDTRLESRNSDHAIAYRVIADHLRSSCFLIADGVLPSNEGRGYVLRRIMRRAMRYAHQIGCEEPLMYRLVPSLITEMGGQYPELARAEATITSNLRGEEERFKQALERGLKLLDEEAGKLSKGQKLSGDAAFRLYDTYGFPLDLTQDILKGRGIGVDTDAFNKAMEGQRDMAREAWKGSGQKAIDAVWLSLSQSYRILFLGYDRNEEDRCKILAIIKNGEDVIVQAADVGDEVSVILNQTPFYGESGGQVGDTGALSINGKIVAEILTTQKPHGELIIHKAKLSAPLRVGETVHAAIDVERRERIRANHSATHLLHKALRDKLGDHVTQKGSLVDANRLRFDFSHPRAVVADELAEIERKVNEVVARNTPVQCKVMAPDEAIKAGAMALFGEKYGDKVRVLSMGHKSRGCPEGVAHDPVQPDGSQDLYYSTELCGGTHVRNTGDIGLFKIVSEGSVASGIRRIEAVTGEGVRKYFIEELQKQYDAWLKLKIEHKNLNAELDKYSKLRKLMPHVPENTVPSLKNVPLVQLPELFNHHSIMQSAAIATLQGENKKLAKALAEAKKQKALGGGGVKVEKIGAVTFIGKILDGLDPKELRPVAE
ncbi:MAG: alanine--tRNA ligase, partial [Pseudomonadota bacterium]|nr:alanine--tRNA ligase [Pseudomonadota bacterium]